MWPFLFSLAWERAAQGAASDFVAALPITPAEWRASQSKVPALLEKVKPQHRERCENVLRGKGRGWSQAWQDWMMYRNFFAGQERGVYLDIGTNEALTISNTAFFDLCLGWEGICFEPQAQYHRAIREQRSCRLVPECVMGRRTEIVESAHHGHSAEFHNRAGTGTGKGKGKGKGQSEAGSAVRTRTCVGVLDHLTSGTSHSQTVDLISIDIEGAEPYVLSCFPWDRLRARLVLIETNHVNQREVDAFFSRVGYANVATMLQTDGSFLDNLYMRLPGGPLVHPGVVGQCSKEDRWVTHCNAPRGSSQAEHGGEWKGWPNITTAATAATTKRMVEQYTKYGYGKMELAKWQCADA